MRWNSTLSSSDPVRIFQTLSQKYVVGDNVERLRLTMQMLTMYWKKLTIRSQSGEDLNLYRLPEDGQATTSKYDNDNAQPLSFRFQKTDEGSPARSTEWISNKKDVRRIHFFRKERSCFTFWNRWIRQRYGGVQTLKKSAIVTDWYFPYFGRELTFLSNEWRVIRVLFRHTRPKKWLIRKNDENISISDNRAIIIIL